MFPIFIIDNKQKRMSEILFSTKRNVAMFLIQRFRLFSEVDFVKPCMNVYARKQEKFVSLEYFCVK